MRKVLVFGTFDGLHEGHRAFLEQARAYGDYLIVAVAPDGIVEQLKKRTPRRDLQERIEAIEEEMIADRVVSGDSELGSYGVVRNYRPDVIALGYDQAALKMDLEDHLPGLGWHIELIVLGFHKSRKRIN